MSLPNELLDAARRLDWPRLESLIATLTREEKNDRVEWLVKEIRQQGYTVCRRHDETLIKRRDEFRSAFRKYLVDTGHQTLSDKWRADDATTAAVEWAYQKILKTVETQALPPDRHVWATLRHMESRLAAVQEAVANWRPTPGHGELT
jgi:hypothetical protein